MSDTEWSAWQATWSGAAGPLPDVRARAQREVRLHRRARIAFFVLVAVGLAGSVPAFTDSQPEVHAIGWMILAFCGAMGLGYGLLQRGLRPEEAGSPRAAVAFLERRLRVERRSAQLVRWGYAGLCAAFVLVFPRMVASHSRPWLEMAISFSFMLLTLVATFSAPWWVARRNRRHEEELEGWRRWMDEQGL